MAVNDGMGSTIPYNASASAYPLFPVEIPSTHEIVCLSGVIGGDMGAYVPTRRAISGVLASRWGYATSPMYMQGEYPNQRTATPHTRCGSSMHADIAANAYRPAVLLLLLPAACRLYQPHGHARV